MTAPTTATNHMSIQGQTRHRSPHHSRRLSNPFWNMYSQITSWRSTWSRWQPREWDQRRNNFCSHRVLSTLYVVITFPPDGARQFVRLRTYIIHPRTSTMARTQPGNERERKHLAYRSDGSGREKVTAPFHRRAECSTVQVHVDDETWSIAEETGTG